MQVLVLQVRVLAARDPSGSVPLYHGHLTNSALFVSSSSCIPADANADDVLEIQPGWKATLVYYFVFQQSSSEYHGKF